MPNSTHLVLAIALCLIDIRAAQRVSAGVGSLQRHRKSQNLSQYNIAGACLCNDKHRYGNRRRTEWTPQKPSFSHPGAIGIDMVFNGRAQVTPASNDAKVAEFAEHGE